MFSGKNWHHFATLTLCVGALAVAIAGCGKKDEPPKAEGEPKPAPTNPTSSNPTPQDPTPPTPPEQPKSESLTNVKPDVVLTAKTLLEEFTKDRDFLSNKYAGKVVQLTGIVDDLREAKPGDGYLALRAGDSYGSEVVRCEVREKNFVKKVLPSQTVVLRMRAPKSASDLGAAVWEIIEAKGTIPVLTAEQFTREQSTAKDDELKKKYDKQHLIVTGTIAEVESSDQGTRLFLRGVGETQVECWFPGSPYERVPFSQTQKETMKAGQTVKVCGQFYFSTGNLKSCILLEPAP